MEFFNGNGLFQIVSKYDGERYSGVHSLEELTALEKKKKEKLKKEGYDVDRYDEIYNQLTEEYWAKFPKMKNIFERADLYDEYEQKKKDLAKEIFGIDL